MRIEVLIGNDDPMIFSLNSTKLVLGSGEQCDIIVSADGISRKHLTITSEDEQYFITDMGSTNGSFMNEERLVPGRRVEFTSFFPVRLGENVLVSLLSDEEDVGTDSFTIPIRKENTSPSLKNPNQEPSNSTTVINLNQLKNIRTENLVLERDRKREIRKKTRKEVKPQVKTAKKPNYAGVLALLIIAGAAYYNFFVMETTEQNEPVNQVGRVVKTTKPAEVKVVVNENLIPKDDLVTKEKFDSLRNNMKCTIDKEIHLCDIIPGARNQGFGVTQIGLSLYVFLDASHYYIQARNYVRDNKDKDLITKTAAFIFASKDLSGLDESLLSDANVFVGFYDRSGETLNLRNIVAFKPKAITKNRERLKFDQVQFIRSIGSTAIQFTEEIYTVY